MTARLLLLMGPAMVLAACSTPNVPMAATAPQPVEIAIIEQGRATPLRYDPAMFDAPAGNPVTALPPGAGFAGFRIMNAARDGDWLSYLGASYFRAPSPQKQFGLSARAVTINTGIQGREEFPRFTHFWLERTGPSSVTIFALLDGASITGAFRFVSRLDKDGVRQRTITYTMALSQVMAPKATVITEKQVS